MKLLRLALAASLLTLAFGVTSASATPTPSQVDKRVSQACANGTKIDDPVSGTAYAANFGGYSGTITFTISGSAAGDLLAFDTNHPTHIITSILIKGGPTQANLYVYPGGDDEDSGLHAPFNANSGKWYGVSHVCFFTAKKHIAK